VRRFLLPLCLLVLTLGVAAEAASAPPTAAVRTASADAAFPVVWAAQAAPTVLSQATTVTAAIQRADAERRWYAVATWNVAVAANEAARVASTTPRHHPPSPARRSAGPQTAESGTGRCGGDLPPCSVMMCESGGSLTARNRSGAAGKWQIMPGTWNGYGGYSSADQAPESVQDARAREIWRGGAGRGAWVCR
jgi:hypothetical protein